LPKHVVIGTAGHIDHGKTSLVRALTGVDTDRWEEEKRRGITIDLGFVRLDLAEDLALAFVDVPGHERFVKNMLAGATGVDLVLLGVAADESVMPQTEEHFEICRLLGVRRGVVALSKVDRVDPDLVELVKLEAEERFLGSFLADAPIVPVSAHTGSGLEELRAALAAAAREVEAKSADRRFRLPIDRVFVKKGFGAVVTGTLVDGRVRVGYEVEILPAGERARVRGLRVHDQAVEESVAGRRTAVNLAGAETSELARGMWLAEPGFLRPTTRLDARIELLASAPPLRNAAPVHFHIGAAEIEGRVFLLDRDPATGKRLKALPPGVTGFVQLRLEEPTTALLGDRFILRRFSPVETIGGGVALDNQAPAREAHERRRARLEALASGSLEAVVRVFAERSAYGVGLEELVARTGRREGELRAAAGELLAQDGRLVALSAAETAEQAVLQAVETFHQREPLAPGLSREAARGALADAPTGFANWILERLLAAQKLEADGELVRLAGRAPRLAEDEAAARRQILDTLEKGRWSPPLWKDLAPKLPVDAKRATKLLAGLQREGAVVPVAPDLAFHASAVEALRTLLAEKKPEHPRFSVSDFKQWTGASRKYAIPMLAFLDRLRLTERVGDERKIL